MGTRQSQFPASVQRNRLCGVTPATHHCPASTGGQQPADTQTLTARQALCPHGALGGTLAPSRWACCSTSCYFSKWHEVEICICDYRDTARYISNSAWKFTQNYKTMYVNTHEYAKWASFYTQRKTRMSPASSRKSCVLGAITVHNLYLIVIILSNLQMALFLDPLSFSYINHIF